MRDDDEKAERERQARERARMSFIERLYDKPIRVTKDGFDDGRSARRTGRIIKLPLRVHPRMKALVNLILEKHEMPSMVVLFEQLVQVYLDKHGDIDMSLLPSDEELIARIEGKRDDDDADDDE